MDKPPGLLSVPGKGPALADSLLFRLEASHPGTRLVHRLDRDTSGVIVFARTPAAQRHLGLQFERRHLAKTYLARVLGWPGPDSGRIDLPLAADWPNRPKQKVAPEGRPARTDWEVLARAPDGTARLILRPTTGRSHQIRVHLATLGHPILGDPLYAPDGRGPHPRLMLHALRLDLRHPEGGRWLSLEAPAPF